MIILRQHNYSKEEEEQSKKKKDSGKKIATKAAIGVGSGLALAGGYQIAKNVRRNKAAQTYLDSADNLYKARVTGSEKKINAAQDAFNKARESFRKKSKVSFVENLGHKPEDWVRSKITRKKNDNT